MILANPYWLLLAALIPAAYFLFRKNKKELNIALPTVKSMSNGSSWRVKLLPILDVLRVLALLLLIYAMARPQIPWEEKDINGEGIDIFLVMDVSSSMLAQDFRPNRLEASKRVANDFIDKRPYDRIGLSAFAGESFTRCPATIDHDVLKELMNDINVGQLSDGTAIGMGLGNAVSRLAHSEAISKVVVLLTDGVNNSGYIKPMVAAQLAQENDVKLYTIGVGSRGQALAPVSRRRNGEFIFGMSQVEIDEELLQEMAQMTGGKYYRATSENDLVQIYNEINQLEKSEIKVSVIQHHDDYFMLFLKWGLLLLLIEFLLRSFVFRILP